MQSLVLRLNQLGQPLGWINWQQAAVLYARDRVIWSLGERIYSIHGGYNRRLGQDSIIHIDPIVAASGFSKLEAVGLTPGLTNRELFRRDSHSCMYCLRRHSDHHLTRDHVVPLSRGGADVWTNVVTACKKCNQAKADRLISESGLQLFAVPYAPNYAEWLILSNRSIRADQMEFLIARCPQDRDYSNFTTSFNED